VLSDADGLRVEGSEVVYAPFGEVRIGEQTDLTDFGYTGQRLDDSTGGLMYYGARYYLPELRRFISADTIVPSVVNPQALNRYSYVTNNPINLIDPSGHRPIGPADEDGRVRSRTSYSSGSKGAAGSIAGATGGGSGSGGTGSSSGGSSGGSGGSYGGGYGGGAGHTSAGPDWTTEDYIDDLWNNYGVLVESSDKWRRDEVRWIWEYFALNNWDSNWVAGLDFTIRRGPCQGDPSSSASCFFDGEIWLHPEAGLGSTNYVYQRTARFDSQLSQRISAQITLGHEFFHIIAQHYPLAGNDGDDNNFVELWDGVRNIGPTDEAEERAATLFGMYSTQHLWVPTVETTLTSHSERSYIEGVVNNLGYGFNSWLEDRWYSRHH
jgi:RHS repeat-associated protein